jgi:CubicO group peptidase (beta-lactamase class C family)
MRFLPLLLLLAPQDEPSKQVDELVAKYVSDETPGCAVLVVKGGEVLHKKGYGLANLEHKVAITSETVFDLASVSKQFTATAVMILADRGDLALDDDIRKTLPEMPEHSKERPIRIADLLHQVSGLKDYLGLLDQVKGDPDKLTNEGALKLIAEQKLDFPTGSKWAYSNSNYCLLSTIVARVSKKKFGDFLKAEIFDPLGMKGAAVFDDARKVIPRRAYGYGKRGKGWTVQHSDLATTGDGAILLSLEDFVLWDKALREGKLVKAETLKLAWTAGKLDDGKSHAYGFGWGVGRADDKLVIDHSGGWAGAATWIGRWVDEGLTVVVLSNIAPGFEPAGVGRKIAKIYRER